MDAVIVIIIECLHWLFMIEHDHHGNEPMLELYADAVAFQIFFFLLCPSSMPAFLSSLVPIGHPGGQL